ncbi:MAG: Crp/Fnr family transcriptional regulator [Flavobacteriales bacterium]
MPHQPLIDYFNKKTALTEAETGYLKSHFRVKKIRKRQYLLEEGDVCRYNSFVVKGCFRMFLIDEKGKERNLQLSFEDWWICDISSFYRNEPSRLYIEALEDSLILQVTKPDLLQLFEDYPTFSHVFRVLAENALVTAQNRILEKVSSTAEERYLDFAKRYPQLFNRIPHFHIASYLGVTPEFLSTIRKRSLKS